MTKHSLNMPVGRPKGVTSYQRDVAKAFGLVLRKHRISKKLTQEDFGNIAGIPSNHVSNIERGENAPTLSLVVKLAQALNVPAALLIAEMENALMRYDKENEQNVQSE